MGGIGNLQRRRARRASSSAASSRSPTTAIRQRVDARDRVRLPRADHGLPPAGPARRGDAGRPDERPQRSCAATRRASIALARHRCSSRSRSCRCSARRSTRFIDDCILALAYVVMALGLNIVVGLRRAARPRLRGLLRLRRARRRAGGPPTTSRRVNGEKGIHVGVSEFADSLPGIHLNFLLIVIGRDHHLRDRGRPHRPAHPAPARRLHRDRDARLRRDHRPRRQNGDELEFFGDNKLTNGRQSISPIDQIDLPLFERVRLGHQPQTVFLDRARPCAWSCCS